MSIGASEFRGFENFGGRYDVINRGQRKKKFFFRPEVTFGVDARWLLDGF